MEGAVAVEILDIDFIFLHVIEVESFGVGGRDE